MNEKKEVINKVKEDIIALLSNKETSLEDDIQIINETLLLMFLRSGIADILVEENVGTDTLLKSSASAISHDKTYTFCCNITVDIQNNIQKSKYTN